MLPVTFGDTPVIVIVNSMHYISMYAAKWTQRNNERLYVFKIQQNVSNINVVL